MRPQVRLPAGGVLHHEVHHGEALGRHACFLACFVTSGPVAHGDHWTRPYPSLLRGVLVEARVHMSKYVNRGYTLV